jgi:hypothetical protein
MSAFWFNDERGPAIGIIAKGHRFESTQVVPSTSVGSKEENVDLVVSTSFGTCEMI